jgi:hypothetical protein
MSDHHCVGPKERVDVVMKIKITTPAGNQTLTVQLTELPTEKSSFIKLKKKRTHVDKSYFSF